MSSRSHENGAWSLSRTFVETSAPGRPAHAIESSSGARASRSACLIVSLAAAAVAAADGVAADGDSSLGREQAQRVRRQVKP